MRAWVVALLLAVACGSVGGQGSSPLPPPSPPTAALAAWKDFPAKANPRPIIWFTSPQLIKGFPDADRKTAWICNKLVLADGVTLPQTTPARATANWPSGVTASYPAISTSRAWAALLGAPAGGNSTDCARAPPLAITAIRFSTASFGTDRGFAQMSAWLFDLAYGSYAYPALDPTAFWHGGLTMPGSIGAKASSDGKTLTLGFVGGPATPGPCGVDYAASAAESVTAVAVAVSSRQHGGPGTVCDLVGYSRTVTVRLSAPIGGRVLLDPGGNPGDVCPESGC